MRAAGWLALTVVLVPSRAMAGERALPDPYDDIRADAAIDAHGLVDLYYAANPARPASHRNALRAFDFRGNEPSIGFARVRLAHRPRRHVGFLVDVGFGDTTDALYRSDPASLQQPDVAQWLSHITQAFVTVDLPIGRGLRVDAGKFATPVGYEGNESLENWNYSRGLLYDWAEPSLHTGFRTTYAPNRALSFSGFLVNGWNTNFAGGTGLRSFALSANWKPRDEVGLAVVYMGGLERDPIQFANTALTFRHLVDATLTLSPSRRFSFVVTADYGHDHARGGDDWWGVGGFARIDPSRWFDAAMRIEVLDDRDGFVTGTPQSVAEVTSTLEVHSGAQPARIAFRIEERHDQSTAFVFDAQGPATRSRQDTLTAALIAAF
jgi:hypothetical protein